MSMENVERVRAFFEEIYCRNDYRQVLSTHAESHVSHLPSGDHYGPEGVRIDIASMLDAFPDLTIALDDVYDAGEAIAYRFSATGTHLGPFLGIGPTGRTVHIEGLGIDRIEDGKFVERWIQFDSLEVLHQLGIFAPYPVS